MTTSSHTLINSNLDHDPRNNTAVHTNTVGLRGNLQAKYLKHIQHNHTGEYIQYLLVTRGKLNSTCMHVGMLFLTD